MYNIVKLPKSSSLTHPSPTIINSLFSMFSPTLVNSCPFENRYSNRYEVFLIGFGFHVPDDY